MVTARPIAVDFSSLDSHAPSGQYRYAVDLIRGLATLDTGRSFVLIGSRADPPPEIGTVIAARPDWRYARFEPSRGHAADLADQVRLPAFLARHRAGLLHALHGRVPLAAPCPVVVTLYDLMFQLFPEYAPIMRSRPWRIERWAIRHRAKRIIAISRTTADDAAALWRIDPRRMDVVHLGIDTARFAAARGPLPGAVAALPAGTPVVLAPFVLEQRKNLAALAEAFALVRAAHAPDARLVLFGHAAVTPDRLAAWDTSIAALGIGPATVRTDIVGPDALAALYRRADVFVYPSLYEGFGLPIVEAMAAGAAVVARGTSAMAEVAGDAALLVETRNVAALADAVARVLLDGDLRRSLAARGRQRAQAFTIRAMAERTLASYRRALGDPRP